MISTRPRAKIIRSRPPHNPCPVCGGDGCGQTEFFNSKCGACDGFGCHLCRVRLTLCWRVEAPRQAINGAYKHFSENFSGSVYPAPRIYAPPPIAPIERRTAVYSALLDRLQLNTGHVRHLIEERRLSEETIEHQKYASIPPSSWAALVVGELARDYDLELVPGFYRRGDRWQLRFGGSAGIIIPLRDVKGRIQALQIRRDGGEKSERYRMVSSSGLNFPGGASSGTPPHFARPHRSHEGIVIIEGGLKGQIVAERWDVCVVGLVAVGTFGAQFGWDLRRHLGERIGPVIIAYDADWRTNKLVAQQLERLQAVLKSAMIPSGVYTWDPAKGKGLDDFLNNQQ